MQSVKPESTTRGRPLRRISDISECALWRNEEALYPQAPRTFFEPVLHKNHAYQNGLALIARRLLALYLLSILHRILNGLAQLFDIYLKMKKLIITTLYSSAAVRGEGFSNHFGRFTPLARPFPRQPGPARLATTTRSPMRDGQGIGSKTSIPFRPESKNYHFFFHALYGALTEAKVRHYDRSLTGRQNAELSNSIAVLQQI